jgi:hypothetical protein
VLGPLLLLPIPSVVKDKRLGAPIKDGETPARESSKFPQLVSRVASVVEQSYQMAAEKPRPRATRSKKPTATRSVL